MKQGILLAGVFVAALSGVLWLAAGAFVTAQERQVTYTLISDALAAVPAAETRVSWQPAEAGMVRPFTEADSVLIGRALTAAWHGLTVAQQSGEDGILDAGFSGPALERARASVADAAAHGGRMAVLRQEARPVFFHADGSVFQAEVELVVARYISAPEGPDGFSLRRDTGVVTLMNEANGWRVFSYERQASAPLTGAPVPWTGRADGLNYYPAKTPWREFWPGFDARIIQDDFADIHAMGATSIRIFLTRDAFLGDAHADTLARLAHLLWIAEQTGLEVIPTLFDLKHSYGPNTWADDALYLSRVLPVLAEAGAVSFIDVKNEPDLDFAIHGAADVQGWLAAMIGLIRTDAPNLPLTVGWASAEAAPVLAEALDVISYHDYAPAEGTAARFDAVRATVGDKPVVVSEIGVTSFSAFAGFPSSEASQQDEIAARLDALAGSQGVLLWTLHDFERVDAAAVGASPWAQRLQSAYGLRRADGSAKPVADTVRTWFAGRGAYTDE